MYRDFSNVSKQHLFELVSKVEDENWCGFTDWFGDRWLGFQSIIGQLNVQNYLNNVDEYHKKVIDKNNATKSEINKIFNNIKSIDFLYGSALFNIEGQYHELQRTIDEMDTIINPFNGKFDTDYILKNLSDSISIQKSHLLNLIKLYFLNIWNNEKNIKELFNLLVGNAVLTNGISNVYALSVTSNNLQLNKKLTIDDIETGIGFISKVNKNIGKYGENEKVGLSSSILGYLNTLIGISNSENSSGLDITSDMLQLIKVSIKAEDGIYKYYEKTLHPYDALKLDAKFGKTMIGLSIASDVAGITNSVLNTYRSFNDSSKSSYDKAAEAIKSSDSFLNLGNDVYIASKASSKALRFVSKANASGKAANQILATEQKLQFTTSKVVTQKIKNVGAGFTIGSAVVSGISSGIKQYGEVTEDGVFDMGDVGSVGMNFALSGLNSMVSSITFGLVDIDTENMADDFESDAEHFVSGDSWAAKYIRNQENDIVSRTVVSIGAGVYILGENTVECVADGAKAVGSWISSGWNTLTSWF